MTLLEFAQKYNLAGLAFFIGSIIVLWRANLPLQQRHRQWLSPIFSLIFTLVVVMLISRYQFKIPQLKFGNVVPPQTLNIGVIWLYVPVKALVHTLTGLLGLLLKNMRLRPPIRWFYGEDGGATSATRADKTMALRPSWFFSRIFFTRMAWLAFLITAFHVMGYSERWQWGMEGSWAALAFLIVAEFAWYFRGPLPKDYKTQEDIAEVKRNVDLEALKRDYMARWSDWLLGHGKHSQQGLTSTAQKSSPCGILAPEDGADACCLVLDELLAGKSILVEDVLPYKIAPCLGFYLRDRLIRGDKVLILVDHEDQIKPAQAWLESLLSDRRWHTLDWQASLDAEPDCLVATLRQDIFRLLHEPWAKDFGLLMILDAQATAIWHGAEVEALVQAMTDSTERVPQVIALADWRVDIEGAMRNVIGVVADDVQATTNIVDAHYLAWRLESPQLGKLEEFQSRIFSRINAYLSPEASLPYPALKAGVTRIKLVSQEHLPFGEFLDEADNAARVGQLESEFQDVGMLNTNVTVVPNDWQARDDGTGAVVMMARDANFNLAATLRKWMPYGREGKLIHVVAPPYLFRDFFQHHLDSLITERRRFSALAPISLSSTWATAYSLYRRLERGFVPLASVERRLSMLKLPTGNPEATLRKLFAEQLDLNHASFSYRREPKFDAEARPFGRFKQALHIELSGRGRDSRPSWHEIVEIKGNERGGGSYKTLERIYQGHLYQHYLEGQVHAFGGQPYRIRRILEEDNSIVAEWIDSRNYKDHYRQNRHYKIAWQQRHVHERREPKASSDGASLVLHRVEVPVTVSTTSYLAFTPLMALDLDLAEEMLIPSPPERHYKHGKVLEASLVPPPGAKLNTAKVAFTLSLLLNEAFLSYYPEAHMYLRVCTPNNRESFSANDSFSRRLLSLVPTLEGFDNADESAVTLYFIEDSPFDLGTLSSLWTNLDNILEELLEYLEWFNKAGINKPNYLGFGRDSLPDQLDIAGVTALLEHLLVYSPKE